MPRVIKTDGDTFIEHVLRDSPGFESGDSPKPVAKAPKNSMTRSFVYDNALMALLLLRKGRRSEAGQVLNTLAKNQREDGSLLFSYPIGNAPTGDIYVRSGAVAWAGYAAVAYLQAEKGGPYREAITKFAP